MSFEIEGNLIKVYPTEQKTASFQAREFVIETVDGQYNQFVKFQLTQDRCQLIDGYNEQDKIKVHFDLRGREWQGKYFTNLNAWRIEGAAQAAPAAEAPNQGEVPPPSEMPSDLTSGGDQMNAENFDDLPF